MAYIEREGRCPKCFREECASCKKELYAASLACFENAGPAKRLLSLYPSDERLAPTLGALLFISLQESGWDLQEIEIWARPEEKSLAKGLSKWMRSPIITHVRKSRRKKVLLLLEKLKDRDKLETEIEWLSQSAEKIYIAAFIE